jgi:23S rRNA (pseudouridine1915-N3)-methyltransferase
MLLALAHIGPRPHANDAFDGLVRLYLDRLAPFAQCEAQAHKTEDAFLKWLDRQTGRKPFVVLLDSRGKQMSSEAFASWLGARRDSGVQHIVFAIGPASGWSETALTRAQLTLSFGPMTLAHALARVVLAEQIYRAYTILTGHPYHCGH